MGEDIVLNVGEIKNALEDLAYTKGADIEKCIEAGLTNQEFIDVVIYLTSEIRLLYALEEQVGNIKNNDEQEWKMELSAFLRELGCPYRDLTEGDVSDRFNSSSSRGILLEFLCSELMAAKISISNKPQNAMHIKVEESETARELKIMLLALGFPKPPDNISSLQLFEKVNNKVRESYSRAPEILRSKPIFIGDLTSTQWNQLEEIQTHLSADYSLRRRMLLTRLDATVQSFSWSEKVQQREGEIAVLYNKLRSVLQDKPRVGIPDLLAAREDAAIMEKVCSSNSRAHTQTSLNKVMIGEVPDRGGRTDTMTAPPPEMPGWSQRQPDQGRGGGRGGGYQGGGGRGGGYQGGGGRGGGYQGGGGRGGYHDGRGDGHQGGGYQGAGGGHHGGGGGGGGRGYQGRGGGGRGGGRVQGAGWSGGRVGYRGDAN
ncbi:protein FAM98B [Eurytemora carolleeae]|uniref:protein FAM98B n=1 Tax=Eurytemora carolleeae TaxID=1294199 RepID=UPI000C76EABE|nr:protein FAM98B [Eurytemora carolleeae]|eukprot:XP_023344439.1 protein FAM98B-like [Eurytemora affinis]